MDAVVDELQRKRKLTMNRKHLYMILTVLILTVLIITSLFIRLTPAAHLSAYGAYDQDYLTVHGNLHNDTYILYPFDNKSLKIGFSKYGEMIDYDTKVGLEYNGATDPWAPNTNYVSEYEWVEGWVINITYWHEDTLYNRWAFALYSDYSGTSGVAGDWNEGVQGGALNASVHGGRKTNGGAVTDPIKVLYNGPRRYVGLMKTTLYETTSHTNPLVSITFTIVFNKVKKQAIWFKDIKRLESPKRWGNLQIEFAERGQWDLESDTGETSGNPPTSYAYIFENQSTVYDYHYQGWYNNSPSGFDATYDVAQIIDDQADYVAYAAYWPKPLRSWVNDIAELDDKDIYTTSSTIMQNWTGDGSTTDFVLSQTPMYYPRDETTGRWDETPMVFVGTNHQVNGSDFTYYRTTNSINFTSAPNSGSDVRAYYKIDGCTCDIPGTNVEPCSPFTNAEWCFEMDATNDIFRACSVFGVTDRNNGTDADMSAYTYNTLDQEVQYLLNETFNPFDLYDAVHKDDRRYVEFTSVDSGYNITLSTHRPVQIPAEWDQYCQFSEKIIDLNKSATNALHGQLLIPKRAYDKKTQSSYHYTVTTYANGTAYITFNHTLLNHRLKILYSTNGTITETHSTGWFGNTSKADVITREGGYSNATKLLPVSTTNSTTWTDAFGCTQNITILYDRIQLWSNVTGGGPPTTLSKNATLTLDFHVKFKPSEIAETYIKVHNATYYANLTNPHSNITYAFFTGNMSVMYTVTTPHLEHMQISGTITIVANHTWTNGDVVFANYTIASLSLEKKIHGRYEWIVVGTDAATIDSIGAAYITEAFDSIKEIHVHKTGMGINDTSFGPNAPFVMGGATSGTKSDYRDTLGRPGLRDDWCETTPISSSDMIFTGGPNANLGTEYFNEFTMAFFARSTYVTNNSVSQSNKIFAVSCWAKNTTGSGSAAISVYKDLNGTIGFLIWGYDGDDTYYASKWFWDYSSITTPDSETVYAGIEYLQHENRGVTDIMLKISYTTCDPTISIVERLGTVSEKDQHDC
jgi:hypothetical protein